MRSEASGEHSTLNGLSVADCTESGVIGDEASASVVGARANPVGGGWATTVVGDGGCDGNVGGMKGGES